MKETVQPEDNLCRQGARQDVNKYQEDVFSRTELEILKRLQP